MSRGEAKRRFTLADHRAATEGVECRKDKDVIDETPAAYKDIVAVMAAQADLVDVVHTLKQAVCVKGWSSMDSYPTRSKPVGGCSGGNKWTTPMQSRPMACSSSNTSVEPTFKRDGQAGALAHARHELSSHFRRVWVGGQSHLVGSMRERRRPLPSLPAKNHRIDNLAALRSTELRWERCGQRTWSPSGPR